MNKYVYDVISCVSAANKVVGYDSSLPYDHPTNQDALSNTLGLGWSDYVFLPFTITSSTINCFSLHQ